MGPLRGKLSRVKHLLDDADKQLQEEATKYEIFTTKASAIGTGTSIKQQNNKRQEFPTDLIRTMSDISTLKSVLSCPIFNRIVNVTDSLDKLSYHLNLHPSITPNDINIDPNNGELMLAPPIEPTSLNNLINSKLDEYSSNNEVQMATSSPPIQVCLSPNRIDQQKNGIKTNQYTIQSQQLSPNSFKSEKSSQDSNFVQTAPNCYNDFDQKQQKQPQKVTSSLMDSGDPNYVPSAAAIISTFNSYNTEKLVSNGNKDRQSNLIKVESSEKAHRLYKTSGQHRQELITSQANEDQTMETNGSQIVNIIQEDQNSLSYSNELYRTTQELKQQASVAIEQQKRQTGNNNNVTKNVISPTVPNSGIRKSCSPPTSASSTVRLADDCDSGASSYQSQTAKVPQAHSNYIYKSNDQCIENNVPLTKNISPSEDRADSLEPEISYSASPDFEKIKVTIERDADGLGITIAGYTFEKEDLSGLFIKGITPGSAADRSGKIKILDQIIAANGKELLGFTNQEALRELRKTGRVVTLELMRFLAEPKYKRLQSALSSVVPNVVANSKMTNNGTTSPSNNLLASPTKSSIPIYKTRNQSPTKAPLSPSSNNRTSGHNSESIYEKITADQSLVVEVQSSIPIAAQRGGTNKVIETKQGARNTIDIRSPIRHATATYVNKFGDADYLDSTKKSAAAQLQGENFDEFGKLVKTEEPEWEKDARIIEIYKDSSQGLGFTVKDYINPKDPKQMIIMITSITAGGIAARDGRLEFGDLLIFVDDTSLEGASLNDAVKALKKANGHVRLGVLKLKRNQLQNAS